ncbi:MAG: hypothetical protein NT013_19615, partial [Planctomycetia bacterium]|nr:hypothetical protein [Planctomycetia bacterium]
IHRCSAPCVGRLSAEQYGQDVAQAMRFLEGDHSQVLTELEKEMEVLVHRWDSIPKRIFPKHPNANLPAMFSSTSLLFRILAFEIHDRRHHSKLGHDWQ